MKKSLKIIIVVIIIIISSFTVLVNTVKAVEGNQIKIYSKGNLKRIIRKDGIAVKTTHAVYEENGKEYPVYCLNKELNGVGDYIATYDVTKQEKIKDLGLWRVIINAYPYKTYQELGTASEEEAYIATKQSIYCYIYNTEIERYSGIGEAGNRVISAMKKILENANKSTESFENQSVEIIQSEEWQIDATENQYISKEYEVKSDINISKYIINLENQVEGTKIANLQNQERSEFNSSEKFKILIPIDKLNQSGQFKINIETQMETKPVFFGKAPSSDLQNYALTTFSYENVNKEIVQEYEKNNTTIIIEKQDDKTEEILEGAKFEILNENKKVIRVSETNENGQIILSQLMPGTYYIREVKAPDGYEINSELQQIEIKMNEQIKIEIGNSKITIIEKTEIEEPPIEEPKIETPSVIEVPKLPVTGM